MDPERGKYFLFIYLFIFNKNRNNDYSFMKSLFTLLQSLNGTEAIKVPRFFFWQGRGGGGTEGYPLKKITYASVPCVFYRVHAIVCLYCKRPFKKDLLKGASIPKQSTNGIKATQKRSLISFIHLNVWSYQ